MHAFTQLQGLAATIPGKNIDTDQIIPARFLKRSRTDPDYAICALTKASLQTLRLC
jgi:3-isopropylmalate dehydratase small subunit